MKIKFTFFEFIELVEPINKSVNVEAENVVLRSRRIEDALIPVHHFDLILSDESDAMR